MFQAYKQSREWVAHNIRSLADSKDKDRADQLEEQAKLLVDNLYHLYEERIKSLPDNTSSVAIRGDWFAQLVSTTNVESLKGEITQIVKENIETVLSVGQIERPFSSCFPDCPVTVEGASCEHIDLFNRSFLNCWVPVWLRIRSTELLD